MSGVNLTILLVYLAVSWPLVLSQGAEKSQVFSASIVDGITSMITVNTTSECGKFGAEKYCTLTGIGKHEFKGQECNVCDARNISRSHPIHNILSPDRLFWKSKNADRKVDIVFNLNQAFFIAYITLNMGVSPRPKVWVLERSVDFGRSYEPWQYFAPHDQCLSRFNMSATKTPANFTNVLCTAEFSSREPLHDGEIIIRLVSDRFSNGNLFVNNTELKEWMNATNIRFRFLDYHTLGGEHLITNPKDLSVTRRFFYSIRYVGIGALCVCPGTSNRKCYKDPFTGSLECACDNNTCGSNCDKCCPLYNQYPWNPDPEQPCQACECHGHASACAYNQTVAEVGLSENTAGEYSGGGVCDCKHNTAGINCERCKPGFFSLEGKDWMDQDICRPCACNINGSVDLSCDRLGQCQCKPQVIGMSCDQCEDNHWGRVGACQACACSIEGSMSEKCDVITGMCPCLPGFTGQRCDNCEEDQVYLQGLGCTYMEDACDNCTITLFNEATALTMDIGPILEDKPSLELPVLVRKRLSLAQAIVNQDTMGINVVKKMVSSREKRLKWLNEEQAELNRLAEKELGRVNMLVNNITEVPGVVSKVTEEAWGIMNETTSTLRLLEETLGLLATLSKDEEWEPLSPDELEKYEDKAEVLIRLVRDVSSLTSSRVEDEFRASKWTRDHVYSKYKKPVETAQDLIARVNKLKSHLLNITDFIEPKYELLGLNALNGIRISKIHTSKEQYLEAKERNLNSSIAVQKGHQFISSSKLSKVNTLTRLRERSNHLRKELDQVELDQLVDRPLVTEAVRTATSLDSSYRFIDMKMETPRNLISLYEKLKKIPHDLNGLKETLRKKMSMIEGIAEYHLYAQREINLRSLELNTRIEELLRTGVEEGSVDWELFNGDTWPKDQQFDEEDLFTDQIDEAKTATKFTDWIPDLLPATPIATTGGDNYSDWLSTLKSTLDWLTGSSNVASDQDFMNDFSIDEDGSDGQSTEASSSLDISRIDSEGITSNDIDVPPLKPIGSISMKNEEDDFWMDDNTLNDEYTNESSNSYTPNNDSSSTQHALGSTERPRTRPTSMIPQLETEVCVMKPDCFTKTVSLSLLNDSLLVQYKVNGTLARLDNLTSSVDRVDSMVQNILGHLHESILEVNKVSNDVMPRDQEDPTLSDIMDKSLAMERQTNATLMKLLKRYEEVGLRTLSHNKEIKQIKQLVQKEVQSVDAVMASLQGMEARWNVRNDTQKRVEELRGMIQRATRLASMIQTPLCLSSPGFIRLRDPETHLSPVTRVQVSMKPADNNGLIYSIGNLTKLNQLQLLLSNGSLSLYSLTKDQSTVVNSRHVIVPNQWLHVSAAMIGSSLELSLYNSSGLVEKVTSHSSGLQSPPRTILTKLVPPVYVGGIPDEIKTGWVPDFEGCLDNLVIGDKPMGLLGSTTSRGIQEIIDQGSEGPSHCVSMNGAGILSLDLKGSTLILPDELKMNPLDIRFSFKTIQKTTLLLHLRDSLNVSHLVVTLEGGAVVVHVTSNQEDKKTSSRRVVYNDGQWHHIQVKRSVTTIKLTVDHNDYVQLKTLYWRTDETIMNVDLGGSGTSFRWLPRLLGCLSNLTINGQTWLMSKYKKTGGTIFNGCAQSLGDCVTSSGESQPLAIDSIPDNIDTISFQFKTTQSNGTIVHFVSGQTRIQLYYLGDQVQLCARDFKMAIRKSDVMKISDSRWHTVVITLGTQSSSVTLDKLSWKIDLSSWSTPTSPLMYLGGTSPGNNNQLPGGTVLPTGMAASFRYLTLNDRLVDLSGQVILRKLTACK